MPYSSASAVGGQPGHVDVDRARCGRSRARPSTNSGSSRRRSRTSPSRSPSAARPSGRRPCAAPAPSCCTACRRRSSRRTGAGSAGTRRRSGRGRSATAPACIISTAQHARPKRHRPHRAVARPVDDAVERRGDEALLEYAFNGHGVSSSFPLQRALLPLVDEADDEHGEEDHHRDEAEEADVRAARPPTGRETRSRGRTG